MKSLNLFPPLEGLEEAIMLAFHPKAQRLLVWQVFWLGFLLNAFPLIEQLLTSTVVLNSAGEW